VHVVVPLREVQADERAENSLDYWVSGGYRSATFIVTNRTTLYDLASLMKTYFNLGGMQVQFNVVDRETLIEAKKHPDRFPGLLVRVSGYSAYFADLTPEMQDEIIARTEQSFGGSCCG